MGWKSTIDLTRERAISMLLYSIDCLPEMEYVPATFVLNCPKKATDEQLCDALEALVGDQMSANFRIVDEIKT